MPSFYDNTTQIPAIISLIFSFFVVFTAIIFPQMRRQKIFMEIITLISLSDMLGNWPYALGIYPEDGTPLCTLAGFCNLFFFPVSWMLTTMLAYFLKCLIFSGKIMPRYQMYPLCVGIPLLFSLLILTTNHYGTNNPHPTSICTYGGPVMSGYIWHCVVYCGLFLACCSLIIFWLVQILRLEYTVEGFKASDQPTFQIVKRALIMYPVALVLCWCPHIIYFLYREGTGGNYYAKAAFDGIKILNGMTTALIFFTHSKEARQRWCKLLKLHTLKYDVCCIASASPMAGQSSNNGEYEEEIEDFVCDESLVDDISRESVAYFRQSAMGNMSGHTSSNVSMKSNSSGSSSNSIGSSSRSMNNNDSFSSRMSEMVHFKKKPIQPVRKSTKSGTENPNPLSPIPEA